MNAASTNKKTRQDGGFLIGIRNQPG